MCTAYFPIGDSAIEAPIDPKRNPVIIWRNLIDGMSCSIGLPVPNIRITNDRPPNNKRAVPNNSAIKNFDLYFRYFALFTSVITIPFSNNSILKNHSQFHNQFCDMNFTHTGDFIFIV